MHHIEEQWNLFKHEKEKGITGLEFTFIEGKNGSMIIIWSRQLSRKGYLWYKLLHSSQHTHSHLLDAQGGHINLWPQCLFTVSVLWWFYNTNKHNLYEMYKVRDWNSYSEREKKCNAAINSLDQWNHNVLGQYSLFHSSQHTHSHLLDAKVARSTCDRSVVHCVCTVMVTQISCCSKHFPPKFNQFMLVSVI